MKSLLIWHLPQAALFGLGFYAAASDGNPGMALISGLGLAGIYTAALMVVRDAPIHMKGVGRAARKTFATLMLLILFATAATPGVVFFKTGDGVSAAVGTVAVLVILGLLWAMALGLWHSFTVRPASPSQPSERKRSEPDLGRGQLPDTGTSRARLDQ